MRSRALAIRRELLGPEHAEVATSLRTLGIVNSLRGDKARAKELHLQTLAMRERIFGRDHPQVAEVFYNLANVSRGLMEFEEARRFAEPRAAHP